MLLVAVPVSVPSIEKDVSVSRSRISFYNPLTRHRLVEHEIFPLMSGVIGPRLTYSMQVAKPSFFE